MDWSENTLFHPKRLPQSCLEQKAHEIIKWAASFKVLFSKVNQWRTEEDSNPRPLDS